MKRKNTLSTITKKMRAGRLIMLTIGLILISAGAAYGQTINPKNPADVLENTARYCETLKNKVYHFFCHEQVTETIKVQLVYQDRGKWLNNFMRGRNNYNGGPPPAGSSIAARKSGGNISNRQNIQKTSFLNEYQIINTGKELKERRILLAPHGGDSLLSQNQPAQSKTSSKMPGVSNKRGLRPPLKTIIYSYKNALLPLRFFAKENQPKYHYRGFKQEQFMGRTTYVIEVKKKKAKRKDPALVTAWVDAEDFSILKFKVLPEAFGGAEYMLKKGKKKKKAFRISDVHIFGKLHEGVRYPTRTEISIAYDEIPKKKVSLQKRFVKHGARVHTTISTVYLYKDYRFFNVSVDEPKFLKTKGKG